MGHYSDAYDYDAEQRKKIQLTPKGKNTSPKDDKIQVCIDTMKTLIKELCEGTDLTPEEIMIYLKVKMTIFPNEDKIK